MKEKTLTYAYILVRRPRPSRRGIAIREVVVIAALALLMLMILVMWLAGQRDESRRNVCLHRQQQIAMAILQAEAAEHQFPGYANVQGGRESFSPPAAVASPEDVDGEKDSRPLSPRPTGWVFGVLPYVIDVDEASLTKVQRGEVDFSQLADDPEIARPYRWIYQQYGPDGAADKGAKPYESINLLVCPDDVSARRQNSVNQLSWVVNTGMADAVEFGELPADWAANGIFQDLFHEGAADLPAVSAAYLTEHDGQANTLLMSENVDAGQWTDHEEAFVGFIWNANLTGGLPTPGGDLLAINELRGEGDGTARFARPSSFHVGGVNAVYASGSAQFISEKIDWLVFTQLMSSWGEAAKLPGTDEHVPKAYR